MPIYDYVNILDSKDVLRDQFYQSSEDAPEIIKKENKEYHKATSSGSFRINGYSYANGYS